MQAIEPANTQGSEGWAGEGNGMGREERRWDGIYDGMRWDEVRDAEELEDQITQSAPPCQHHIL